MDGAYRIQSVRFFFFFFFFPLLVVVLRFRRRRQVYRPFKFFFVKDEFVFLQGHLESLGGQLARHPNGLLTGRNHHFRPAQINGGTGVVLLVRRRDEIIKRWSARRRMQRNHIRFEMAFPAVVNVVGTGIVVGRFRCHERFRKIPITVVHIILFVVLILCGLVNIWNSKT